MESGQKEGGAERGITSGRCDTRLRGAGAWVERCIVMIANYAGQSRGRDR